MDRVIVGFHLDEVDDWVAELSCGHRQHVRHQPPFRQRPWVLNDDERATRRGTTLTCPLCDRGELPTDLRPVRSSVEWTEQSVPSGLLRCHRLAPDTWGLIHVHEGRLRFSMASEPGWTTDLLGPDAAQGIPPDADHQVEPLGAIRFSIEFFAVDLGNTSHVVPDRSGEPTVEGGEPACLAELVCPECGAVLNGSAHRAGCRGPAGLTPNELP